MGERHTEGLISKETWAKLMLIASRPSCVRPIDELKRPYGERIPTSMIGEPSRPTLPAMTVDLAGKVPAAGPGLGATSM